MDALLSDPWLSANWWWAVPITLWCWAGATLKLIKWYRAWMRQRHVVEGLVNTSSTRPPPLNDEQVRLREAILSVAEGTRWSAAEVGAAAQSMAQMGIGLNQIIQNVSRIAADAPVWSELSFESRVQTMMAEAVTRDLDNSFINGTPLQLSATFPPPDWTHGDAAIFEERRDARGRLRLRRCHRCGRTGIPIETVCVKRYKDNRGTEVEDFETLCRRCEEGVRKAHIVTEPEPPKIRVIRMGQRKE